MKQTVPAVVVGVWRSSYPRAGALSSCTGHGLSYTSFGYSNLKAGAASVTIDVTNTGKLAGADIPQASLRSPVLDNLVTPGSPPRTAIRTI